MIIYHLQSFIYFCKFYNKNTITSFYIFKNRVYSDFLRQKHKYTPSNFDALKTAKMPLIVLHPIPPTAFNFVMQIFIKRKIFLFLQNIMKKVGHIQKLIAEGEHQMLDFKFEVSDSKKIARSLVAFANTDGGRLLIGVKDNGSISGIRSDEEKHMIQTAAQMYCRPEVEYTAKEWNINGKTVLEVIIPKSKHHKHKAPDHNNIYKVYVRVKDENIVANSILIKVWKHEKDKNNIQITFTDEEMLLLRYLNEHKRISFDEFMEISHLNKKAAERILVNFILIGMVKMEMSDKKIFFISADLA